MIDNSRHRPASPHALPIRRSTNPVARNRIATPVAFAAWGRSEFASFGGVFFLAQIALLASLPILANAEGCHQCLGPHVVFVAPNGPAGVAVKNYQA